MVAGVNLSDFPSGWGFAPWAECPHAKAKRDRQRVREAIRRLQSTGYAYTDAPLSALVRDTAAVFGMAHCTAMRCVNTARGLPYRGKVYPNVIETTSTEDSAAV